MELRINSWLPVTAPVPIDRLRDSYIWAMQNRQSQFPLSAVELVDAWKHLVQRAETEGSSGLRDDRLLPQNASGACLRCDKEGREIHLDGSIGGMCDHRPFTEEEKAEAARYKEDFLANARAEADKRLRAKRDAELRAKKSEPEFFNIRMECNSCHRRTDNPMGEAWKDGDTCGVRLSDDSFCKGQLYPYKRVQSPV